LLLSFLYLSIALMARSNLEKSPQQFQSMTFTLPTPSKGHVPVSDLPERSLFIEYGGSLSFMFSFVRRAILEVLSLLLLQSPVDLFRLSFLFVPIHGGGHASFLIYVRDLLVVHPLS
jgi:hypothetical protein